MEDKYLTVSAITKYLKYKFDTDDNLKNVFIKGEISNFKHHSTGHLYFSIKDETSKINAIMFSSNARKLNFEPVEGSKVLIAGRISIYEATGNYQIYVEEMIEDGVGNLYLAFEKLKKKLDQEGLFDEKHKKKIPKYPKKIGIVTAKTGAAIRDIITTIERRYPLVEIKLFPTLVQGENASIDIVKKIKQANKYDLDVLIVGRGGGSIEDLWPFNEEEVAYAIYESKIPIISAVGHEIDYTISDLVADLRAPTPTGAAELAVPNIYDVKTNINNLHIRVNENIRKKIDYLRLYLNNLKNNYIIKNPYILIENKKQSLDYLNEKLNNNLVNKLDKIKLNLINLKEKTLLVNPLTIVKEKKQRLNYLREKSNIIINNYLETNKLKFNNLMNKLDLVNPLNILKKGYTLVYEGNKVITDFKSIKKDDELIIKSYDYEIKSSVIESRLRNGKK